AFSEVVRLFFNNFFVDWFGGPSGLVGIPKPGALPWFGRALTFTTKLELYTLMAVLLLVTAAVLVRLEHSRFGLVASPIRQGDLLRELHHYETLVFGVVLILTMLWAPDGLVALPGKLARRRRVGVSLAP